jgi:hypothetical protein
MAKGVLALKRWRVSITEINGDIVENPSAIKIGS